MMSPPPVFVVAPVPPYTVQAPGPAAAQAPRRRPTFSPVISYKPLPAAPAAMVSVGAPTSPPVRSTRRGEAGLMLVGGLLLFSAALILIAFVVNAHAFATAAEHYTANLSLTEEARKVGVEQARAGALVRTLLFGPGAIVFGSAGLFALVSGQRRRR